MQVARDCAETGIEISLWHLPILCDGDNSGSAKEFDPNAFYTEVLLGEKDYKKWLTTCDGAKDVSASSTTAESYLEDEEGDEGLLSLSDRIQGSGTAGFDAKEYRMRRKEHKKRRLGTLMLNLNGTGLTGGSAIAMGYLCVPV